MKLEHFLTKENVQYMGKESTQKNIRDLPVTVDPGRQKDCRTPIDSDSIESVEAAGIHVERMPAERIIER